MTTDPSPGHAGRMKFQPFARRRARKATAAAAQVEQRAWWHQRWSDSVAAFRKRTKDRVSVSRRRIEADRDAGFVHVQVPTDRSVQARPSWRGKRSRFSERRSTLMAPTQIIDGHLVPRDDAWVHRTGDETRMVNGRWGSAPYRNPARAAKLAKAGRLRRDLEA